MHPHSQGTLQQVYHGVHPGYSQGHGFRKWWYHGSSWDLRCWRQWGGWCWWQWSCWCNKWCQWRWWYRGVYRVYWSKQDMNLPKTQTPQILVKISHKKLCWSEAIVPLKEKIWDRSVAARSMWFDQFSVLLCYKFVVVCKDNVPRKILR